MRLTPWPGRLLMCIGVVAGARDARCQTLRPRSPAVSIGEFGLRASQVTAAAASDQIQGIFALSQEEQPTDEQLNQIEVGLQSAIEFASTDSRNFLKALRWQRDYPEVAAQAAKSSAIAQKAMWASIALNDDLLKKALQKAPDVQRHRIEFAAKELRRLVSKLLPQDLLISLYADANLRGAFEGDSGDARAGTGAFGIALQKGEASLAFSAVVASSVDTVDANPGPLILSPGTGRGRLASFQIDLRSPHLHLSPKSRNVRTLGLHSYLSGSNSIWSGLTTSDTRITENATVLGFGILAYHDIARTRFLKTDIALSAEAGWSIRWLKGNAGVDDSLRRAVLKTAESSFNGGELGFQVNAGAVAVGVQYYIYGDHNGKARVPNLTSGQLIIGVGITGNMLQGPATPTEVEE
jgi:hypothetical protein